MTERIATRTTALLAALLLVLGTAALGASTAGDGEVSFVRAAEQSEPEQAKPDGTGNACPEASPQGADEDPACGTDGKGENGDRGASGEKGKSGEKGDQGEGTGDACPDASPNAGGEPPCGDAEDDEEVEGPAEEECVEEGGTWEDGECVEGEGQAEEECVEEGGTWEDGECVEGGDGKDGARCDGSIGKEFHANDPTGFANDPDATGPVSGPTYDNGSGSPLEAPTRELACIANVATL
jgi:hypothetical protein